MNDKQLILSVNDNLQLIEQNKVTESIAWELLKSWNFLMQILAKELFGGLITLQLH